VIFVLLVRDIGVISESSENMRQGQIEDASGVTVVPLTVNSEKFNLAEVVFILSDDLLLLSDLLAHDVLWGPVRNSFGVVDHPLFAKVRLREPLFRLLCINSVSLSLLKFSEDLLAPLLVLLVAFFCQDDL